MNTEHERIIKKGMKDYSSLTEPELETFNQVRQTSLRDMYETLPTTIREDLLKFVKSLEGHDVDGFYAGFIASMEWYRDLLKASTNPQFMSGVDLYHCPLYVVINVLMQESIIYTYFRSPLL
jgi:hypothetical protein